MRILKLFLGLVIFVATITGLEYLIRHGCSSDDVENRWKWDRWDSLTLGVSLFVGLCLCIIMHCRSKYVVLQSSFPPSISQIELTPPSLEFSSSVPTSSVPSSIFDSPNQTSPPIAPSQQLVSSPAFTTISEPSASLQSSISSVPSSSASLSAPSVTSPFSSNS